MGERRHRRLPKPSGDVWPFGTDGSLIILNGETVTISDSAPRKDYSSIRIDVGGTLQFDVSVNYPAIIGCSGNCAINGQILLRTGIAFEAASLTAIAPDGYTAQIDYIDAVGGAGGDAGAGNFGLGGSQGSGQGGGGGGAIGNDGQTPDETAGGVGGDGSGVLGGGLGGTTFGDNGGPGGNSIVNNGIGAGGGGGFRGYCGQMLYLKVEGILSGTGTISAAGTNGGNGGKGGNCVTTGGDGGGGGGAGAGGKGGKIVIRYKTSTAALTLNVATGVGGSGGLGGNHGTSGFQGDSGHNGVSGGSGSVDIAAY